MSKVAVGNIFLLIALFLGNLPSAVAHDEESIDPTVQFPVLDQRDPQPSAEDAPFRADFRGYHQLLGSKYALLGHNRTYMIPISHIFNPNEDLYSSQRAANPSRESEFYRKDEGEFQISFFLPVVRHLANTNWDLLGAYTNRSWWQVYNAAWSKPFRETNHNPELFFRRLDETPVRVFGLRAMAYDLGYMHESNGQMQGLSRSWDRLFARVFLTNGTLLVRASGWLRVPEREKDDDNPEILRYGGVGQVEIQKTFGAVSLELKVQAAERPGAEIRLSLARQDQMRYFVMGNFGYGQSMIEYDQNVKRIGVGLMLENFLDNGPVLEAP